MEALQNVLLTLEEHLQLQRLRLELLLSHWKQSKETRWQYRQEDIRQKHSSKVNIKRTKVDLNQATSYGLHLPSHYKCRVAWFTSVLTARPSPPCLHTSYLVAPLCHAGTALYHSCMGRIIRRTRYCIKENRLRL